jgi:hypothetical protein
VSVPFSCPPFLARLHFWHTISIRVPMAKRLSLFGSSRLVLITLTIAAAIVASIGSQHLLADKQTATTLDDHNGIATSAGSTSNLTDDYRHGNGICEVHQCKMDTELIHSSMDDVSFDSKFLEAQEKEFPNAGPYGLQDPTGQAALIYVCPKCKSARDSWLNKAKTQRTTGPTSLRSH